MGIMGRKNKIDNIKIRGREFHRFKSLLKRYFNITGVYKIFHVIEGKRVHQVMLEDGNSVRLDVHEELEEDVIVYLQKKAFYHKLASENDIKVPPMIGTYTTPTGFYKCSKWIKGQRVGFVWNLPHVFQCAGREIAKINLLKAPGGNQYLGYNDFNKPNAIWTKNNELYLVDVEIQPKKSVDNNVVKMLLKNIDDRDRIDWFLRGYSEFRSTDKIEKELKRRNYKW